MIKKKGGGGFFDDVGCVETRLSFHLYFIKFEFDDC
jgi:hypothetical protein